MPPGVEEEEWPCCVWVGVKDKTVTPWHTTSSSSSLLLLMYQDEGLCSTFVLTPQGRLAVKRMLTVFFSRYISIRKRVCVCVCGCVYTARDKTHVMMTAATAVHVILVVVVVDVVCRRLHVARASQRYVHTPLHLQRAHLHVGRARRVCTLIRLQCRNNFGTIEFP